MTLKYASRESHLGRQHKKQGELLMHSIAFLSSENKASICFVLDCIIPWQILWSVVILHCCNIETLHPLTCAPELIALKFPTELLQWKINRASKTSAVIWVVGIMSCVCHGSCSIPAKLLNIEYCSTEGGSLYLILSLSIEFVHKDWVECSLQLITKWYHSNHVAVVVKMEIK